MKRKSGDDLVSACRNVVVAGGDVQVGVERFGENM